jgi:methylated-DNA-protein-cysteine methyltransferase-like protein
VISDQSVKSFYERVIHIIRSIPRGKVATYGQIAAYAGNPRASRQVAYILHSSAEKEHLPWHRVINRKGRVSLKPRHGYELQKQLMEDEGILFDEDDCIDLQVFQWSP